MAISVACVMASAINCSASAPLLLSRRFSETCAAGPSVLPSTKVSMVAAARSASSAAKPALS